MRKGAVSTLLICLALGLGAGGVAAKPADGSLGAGIAAGPHTRCCVQIDVSVFAAGIAYEQPASSDTGSYNSAVQWEEQLIGEYQWSPGFSFINVLHPGWAEASINEQQGIVGKDGTRDHWCTDNYGNRVYSHDWSKRGAWDPSDFGITIDSRNVGPVVAPFTAFLWCGAQEPVFPGPGGPHLFGAVAGEIGWQTLWPGMSTRHIAAFKTGHANFALHCEYRNYNENPGEVRKGFVSAGITITSFPEQKLKKRLKATKNLTGKSFPRSAAFRVDVDDYEGLFPPSGTPPGPWPSGSPTTKPTCTHP